ncbi:MAG: SMC family ATPase [Anaerolineaceae bacterium]|jgi:exonuclease SbcC|nr:SMC family ATPase [Anaerolineaceae bacterium]
MIPVRLYLQGFLSYLDPVELDFSNLDVACISGANGAGKSALLDAITWSLFGQARSRDESVINRHADAAQVIFEFAYEGDLYQVERTNPRGKTKMLEFRVQNDSGKWMQLTEHTLRLTESRIEETLSMDYETFTNASFFLQGRADQFAQQRPGDRKRILTSILGLEDWDRYRERTIVRRREQEKELAGIDRLLEEIHEEIQTEPARRARLAALEEDLAQLEEMRKLQESVLEDQRRLKSALTEQQQVLEMLGGQLASARQRLEQNKAALAEREAESARVRDQLQRADEITAAYQHWQAARESLAEWDKISVDFHQADAKRAAPLAEIDRQRSILLQEEQTLQEKAQEMEALTDALPKMEAELDEVRRAVEAANARLAERAALQEEEHHILDEQTEAKAENKRLKDQMNELKARLDQLEELEDADCPLCGQHLEQPEELLQHLKNEGQQQGDRYRANQARMKDVEQRVEQIREELKGLQSIEGQLRQQQRELDQWEERVKIARSQQAEWQENGRPRLREVGDILKKGAFALETRTVLAEIDASLKVLGYDAAAHDAVRRTEVENRESEQAYRQLENARAALAPLEHEIERLKAQATASEQETAEAEKIFTKTEAVVQKAAESVPDIARAERDLRDLRERENILRAEIGGARQWVKTIADQKVRQTEQTQAREAIARQVGYLKTLERAFGKDGVPALLIEQALPEIENQANELLDRLTDGQMSVRFSTQRDYKDKKRTDKKETLDILISDAAGAREYELFSGGEAFRINFAIRLALSRVLAQRAGGRLQMLVIDEGFGSQDAEGRQRLIEVINLVRDDFARILVITHLEQLKDAFPARIEVEKTLRGSQVTVIT